MPDPARAPFSRDAAAQAPSASSCTRPLVANPLAAFVAVPVQVGEATSSLLDDHRDGRQVPDLDVWVGGDLGDPLGDQHVLPGVADAAGAPAAAAELDDRSKPPIGVPVLDPAPRELGAVRSAIFETWIGWPSAERALPAHRPPAPRQRRHRDDADLHLPAVEQRDQRRPGLHPADIALGAVDRVDDPLAGVGGATGSSPARRRIPRRSPRRPGGVRSRRSRSANSAALSDSVTGSGRAWSRPRDRRRGIAASSSRRRCRRARARASGRRVGWGHGRRSYA